MAEREVPCYLLEVFLYQMDQISSRSKAFNGDLDSLALQAERKVID